MRLGWRIHLFGPFYVGGTVVQTHREYVRKYQPLDCGHAHRSLQAYYDCPVVKRRNHER